MNYEIVKVENEGGRQVAYLFDKESGKVIKTLVEDRTGLAAGQDRLVPPVNVPNNLPGTGYEPPTIGGRMIPVGLKPPTPQLPDKPAPLRPPPHLAGVMIEHDQPGAATETRRV